MIQNGQIGTVIFPLMKEITIIKRTELRIFFLKQNKQPLSGGYRGVAQIDARDVPGTSTDSPEINSKRV